MLVSMHGSRGEKNECDRKILLEENEVYTTIGLHEPLHRLISTKQAN